MFLDLIKLHGRDRVPLEDFNTECFANILRLYEKVKLDFIYNFLKLDDDNYIIETQLWRALSKDKDCFIDLVLLGTKNVCFIENKIESVEGDKQLKRYGDVLDLYFNDLTKHLCYCTKYTDIKNQNEEYSKYNFKQFKWFEIAKFLRKHEKDNPLIKEYLIFLNHYKMGQDNTIKAENLLSMENMLKTIEIIEFHIENSKHEFITLFGNKNLNKNFNYEQLKAFNRFCYYNSPIIYSATDRWSEILFSIELNTLKLNCHIYMHNDHESYSLFKELNNNNFDIKSLDAGHGFSYYIMEDLGKYINNNDSDMEIKEWFKESFLAMKNLIEENPQLDWKLPQI